MESCLLPGAGLGAGPAGSMPAGSMMPEGIALGHRARALSLNSALVQFSGDATLFGGAQDEQSPMNADNWSLEPLGPGVKQRYVQHVELRSVWDGGGELVVYVDGALLGGESYRLVLGIAQLTGCYQSDFVAVHVDPTALQQDERDDDGFLRDVANPSASKYTVNVGVSPVGTYQVGADGDLASDGGVAGLHKRLLRRVTTAAGAFLHLQGYGVAPGMKRNVTPDVAGRLSALARAQALREPEVASAAVRVSQVAAARESVVLDLRAQTHSGDAVDVRAPIELP